MARRKNKEVTNPKSFTVDEVLDQADEACLTDCIIIGHDEDGQLAMFGTTPFASFFHHMCNTAVFQLNVLENNSRMQLQEEEVNKDQVGEDSFE